MYSDTVRDHAANPRNPGPLPTATHTGVAGVPGDGPYMILWLEVAGERIVRAAFQTYGCPAAIASGSLTTVIATGRTVQTLRALTAQDLMRLLGGLPEGREECAHLAITALSRAFAEGSSS